jgi:hypothetical protein
VRTHQPLGYAPFSHVLSFSTPELDDLDDQFHSHGQAFLSQYDDMNESTEELMARVKRQVKPVRSAL